MLAANEVIYMAIGRRYREEVLVSAASVRANTTDTRITVFTDDISISGSGLFDATHYIPIPDLIFSQKISCIARATAERCLFLDTDTLVCANIDSLFQLLSRFDIAACHASWRFSPALRGSDIAQFEFIDESVPEPFVDFNTGVIAFRKSSETMGVFKAWGEEYDCQLSDPDIRPANEQAAFRTVVWRSPLRLYVLPPEFNYRCDFPGALGGELRIIHGRDHRIREIANRLASERGARAFDPNTWQLLTSRYLNAKPS